MLRVVDAVCVFVCVFTRARVCVCSGRRGHLVCHRRDKDDERACLLDVGRDAVDRALELLCQLSNVRHGDMEPSGLTGVVVVAVCVMPASVRVRDLEQGRIIVSSRRLPVIGVRHARVACTMVAAALPVSCGERLCRTQRLPQLSIKVGQGRTPSGSPIPHWPCSGALLSMLVPAVAFAAIFFE